MKVNKYTNLFSSSNKGLVGDKFVGEIIKDNSIKFDSNNLIISPTGSGKTFFIENYLRDVILNGGLVGRVLMLVSNSYLKDSICPLDISIREEIESNIFRTGSVKTFGDGEYEVHLMSYVEFGLRIQNNNDFLEGVTHMFCDEIHSMIEYGDYSTSIPLIHSTKYVLDKHEGIQKFYFTATDEMLKIHGRRNPGSLRHIKVFNFMDNKEIKKLGNKYKDTIRHLSDLDNKLSIISEDFIKYGRKGFGYCRTIDSMERMADLLEGYGFKVITLWSAKSEFKDMNEEQLRVRDELIRTNKIPAPYNFLIVNSAMREGWNLKDEDVELVITNTTRETDIVQARGRVRKSIELFIYRDNSVEIKPEVNVPIKYMNKTLTKVDKDNLVDELNIYNSRGRKLKWNSLKPMLIEVGYDIEDKLIRNNDKVSRVSIITSDQIISIKEVEEIKETRTIKEIIETKEVDGVKEVKEIRDIKEVKEVKVTREASLQVDSANSKLFKANIELDEEQRCSDYIARLKKYGFEGKYYDYIGNYGGISILYSNIKKLYKRKVINENQPEAYFNRKIDMLLRNKKMLTIKNYEKMKSWN